MSLNWKEIDLILEELDLPGAQIQSVVQGAFDVICIGIHKKGVTKRVLISLSPGACRIHETFRAFPKSGVPLRFAQFLNSRIVNGWIETAEQLGDNRIVRILVRRGENRYRLYARLWSNAANCIVTDESGTVLDAMRRLPKKGEISGGHYAPEELLDGEERRGGAKKEYFVREFAGNEAGADGGAEEKPASFNRKIDEYYAEKGGALSLEALREQAEKTCEGSIGRISAALEKLRAREAEFANAEKLREYGDIILANIAAIKQGDAWLETGNMYAADGGTVRIKLDPLKKPAAQAELYFQQYRKAKNGLAEIRAEIESGEKELAEVKDKLARLLTESNPLVLAKLLKSGGPKNTSAGSKDKKRPGLSFRRGEWLIIVGRDAAENDALLRGHVKGNDLWLHARDFPGSYVFVKQRSGKSFPLDILLDAGNLAVFYSKGRNNGAGDLFYTPVKYLRRAKDAPKGTVIPAHEKNLRITLDEKRLKELESCRIEKA